MWGDAFRQARMQSLKKAYRLTDELKVNIAANIALSRIRVEGQDLPYNRFSGVLFGATNVTAESAEGYDFVGWDKVVTVCDGDKVYTAVYEPVYKNYTIIYYICQVAYVVLSSQKFLYFVFLCVFPIENAL